MFAKWLALYESMRILEADLFSSHLDEKERKFVELAAEYYFTYTQVDANPRKRFVPKGKGFLDFDPSRLEAGVACKAIEWATEVLHFRFMEVKEQVRWAERKRSEQRNLHHGR